MKPAVALIAIMLTLPAQAQPVPEPAGFRGEPYRDAVPVTLTGAQVINTARAMELHGQGVAFLDVLPRKKRPENLPPGTLWVEEVHHTIPGAKWLYDTGYQQLSPAEAARLEDGLTAATGNDKSAPVVLFCKADCWMSWNAAKRAVTMGYSAVNWFPDGVDGWTAGGGDLVVAVPDPLP